MPEIKKNNVVICRCTFLDYQTKIDGFVWDLVDGQIFVLSGRQPAKIAFGRGTKMVSANTLLILKLEIGEFDLEEIRVPQA